MHVICKFNVQQVYSMYFICVMYKVILGNTCCTKLVYYLNCLYGQQGFCGFGISVYDI